MRHTPSCEGRGASPCVHHWACHREFLNTPSWAAVKIAADDHAGAEHVFGGPGRVRTEIGVLGAELPASSVATTLNENAVSAPRPVTVAVVAMAVATCAPPWRM